MTPDKVEAALGVLRWLASDNWNGLVPSMPMPEVLSVLTEALAERAGANVEALVVAMAENYEMYADEGHYMPNEHERLLLLDFAHEVSEALGREPFGEIWLPIESAPKDYSRVLLTEGGAAAVGFYDAERREWMTDSGWVYGLSSQPTHWQPLPEPPHE